MGDALKKVQAGEKIVIPAEAYNAFIDAALDLRRRQLEGEAEASQEFRQTGIVKVRNDSGGDRERFDVLGINGPLVRPDENLVEFKNRVTLIGGVPWDGHRGKFVVLLEPLKAGAIGRAVLSGVSVGRVLVTEYNRDHCCADVLEGDPTQLQLIDGGAAQVLWREDGDGQKWAVLRLGQVCPCETAGSSSGVSSSGSDSSSASDSGSSIDSSSGTDSSSDGDSSGSEPSASDPSGSDSSGSEPPPSGSSSEDESSGSDPSGSDPSGSDPSGSSSDDSSFSDGSSSDFDSSSSDDSSGSDPSSSGPGDVVIHETDVRCEDGKLNVYKRAVTLQIINCVLTSEVGPWQFDHQAGCCCCDGCADGSSSLSLELSSVELDSSSVGGSSSDGSEASLSTSEVVVP